VIAVVFAIVMNVTSYWFSHKLVVAISGARLAPDAEFPELHNLIENLSITAGLPKPKIYIINDPAPNAFATGRDPEHAVVAVTTGLMQMLDRTELEGVIAHELSHIGNRDMLVSTVAVVLVGFVTLISDFFLRATLTGGGNRDNNRNPILMIVAVALIVLAPIVATLLQLAISRKREFLADASGALLTRYPEGLASALQKIGSYASPMRRANNATAHLFISNPFGPKKAMSGLAKLFMTHPPIEERIKALLGR
jgi:heat shock protein HtpX